MVAVRFGPPEKSNSIASRVEGDGDEINSGITNWLLDDLDTEEEHLLNFFMSDMASGSIPTDDTKDPLPNALNTSFSKRLDDAKDSAPHDLNTFVSKRASSDVLPSILKQPTVYEPVIDNDPLNIPKTPAMQFYPRSVINKGSNLPTHITMQSDNVEKFQRFPHHSYEPITDSISPISPASMGTSEVLMLPGSNTAFVNSAPSSVKSYQRQLDHIQTHHAANVPPWLQHLNMVASMSAGNHMTSQHQSRTMPSTTDALKSSSSTYLHPSKHHPMRFHSIQERDICLNNPMHRNSITTIPNHMTSRDDIPIPDSVLTSAQSIANIFSTKQKLYTGKESNEEGVFETKEKRERRLARNRESARQSRRRKKELLLSLRGKVKILQDLIEAERKFQLESMEKELFIHKNHMLQEIFKYYSEPLQSQSIEKLIYIIKNEGPATTTRLAAIEFQFRQLRRLILPPCEQFLLHLTLKDPSFFHNTKESIEKIKASEKASPVRISSRMAGEELVKSFEEDLGESFDGKLSCKTSDDKLWPLFCLELVIGMEQEEKLLQVLQMKLKPAWNQHKRDNLLNLFSSMETTQQKFLSSCSAVRNLTLTNLLHILSPAQTLRYLQWMSMNRERCKRVISTNESHSNHSVNKLFEALDIKKRDD